jgi:hypothetical protein
MTEAAEERRRLSLASMPAIDPTEYRGSSRRWVWIVLLLVVLAIGGGLFVAHRLGVL